MAEKKDGFCAVLCRFIRLFFQPGREPCRGISGKNTGCRAEDDAFRSIQETEEYGEDADGAADKETANYKTAHTRPHGRAFRGHGKG